MKISIGDRELSGTDLFWLIFRGWFTGVTVIFLPLFLLASVLSLVIDSDGSTVELIISVPMVPLIAALQGLMIAALVVFGLKIWPPGKVNNAQTKQH